MSKVTKNRARIRLDWIDQLKGFAIFIGVWGHNFPFVYEYIHSFRMPLFFLIAGIFHSTILNKETLLKRSTRILIPYFGWSAILFAIWFFFGRHYGESSQLNLSPIKNFIGIFYAQGGRDYMDWGIPMWFLPVILVTYIVFAVTITYFKDWKRYVFLIVLFLIGYYLKAITRFVWSIDIAFIALVFYGVGYFYRKIILDKNNRIAYVFVCIGALHIVLHKYNSHVDMYSSIYGNLFLFVINGLLGSFFYVGIFKLLPIFSVFSFLGKNTITILALQIRSMTFIKLLLFLFLGISVFKFSEGEKFFLSIVQVIIMLPVIFFVNKYIPILNGVSKK